MTARRASGRGVGHGLAEALGIPPELAAPAGPRAMAAMTALQQAKDAGGGWLRESLVADAQREIARIDPYRHGNLLQHLQGVVLALGGRNGDTRIAHVTPGEAVVPDDLMTPEVVDLLRRAAREKGLDPDRFVVGGRRNSINPRTGLMEFFGESVINAPASPRYYPEDNTIFPADPPMSRGTGEWFDPRTGVLPGMIHSPSPEDYRNIPDWGLVQRQRALNGIENMGNVVGGSATPLGWVTRPLVKEAAKLVPEIMKGPIDRQREIIAEEQRRRLGGYEDDDSH